MQFRPVRAALARLCEGLPRGSRLQLGADSPTRKIQWGLAECGICHGTQVSRGALTVCLVRL